MNHWTDAKLKQMKFLYLEGGMSYKKIGGIMGVSLGSIAGKLHRMGVRRGKKLPVKGFTRMAKSKNPVPTRVTVPLKRIKKPDITEIKERGECRGVLGDAEGLALKLCRKKISHDKEYCKKHQKLYYRKITK